MMKNTFRSSFNFFQGKHKESSISFDLILEKNQVKIRMENSLTQHSFIQNIDKQFIQERQCLSCFIDPIALYDSLVDNFGKIKVNKNVISFLYIWGNTIKRQQFVEFQLVEQGQDQLKIKRLEKMLIDKDTRINKIEKELQLKDMELRMTIDSKDLIIKQLQASLEKLQKKEKQYEDHIAYLKQNLAQSTKKSEQLTQMAKIDPHPKNRHNIYYSIKRINPNSIKIIRQGQDRKDYNFVNIAEISLQKVIKYYIKITKTTKYKNILIGFCSNTGLGNIDNFKHPQSAYYYCGGYFYVGGKRYNCIQESCVGDIITCEAVLYQNMFRWRKNGTVLYECQVPQQMKGKVMYLSLIIYRKGDDIELSI